MEVRETLRLEHLCFCCDAGLKHAIRTFSTNSVSESVRM